MYDLIIAGSGPAGLSAGIYAKRAGLNALVIEKEVVSGGQVLTTYEVDNYPGLPGISGYDLGTGMRAHADKLGVSFAEDTIESVEKENGFYLIKGTAKEYEAKGLIIATGAHHATLGVPGEENLQGMGVSYCATCDGAFFAGLDVAVVGGGDVAVEDAIFLARSCRKVYLIHRRDELRAAKSLQKALFACENVELIWDTVVKEIKGNDSVESINIYNKKTGESGSINVNGVFVAVGIIPNTENLSNIADCNEKGYFVAGEDCRCSSKFIYAAGDVRTKQLRQIVTAVADGANAVTSFQQDSMIN